MGERRSLIEGVAEPSPPVDPVKVAAFVNAAKSKSSGEAAQLTPTTPVLARSPFSTRIRTDLTVALKRASLERQLKGVEPNSLVEILEQAIEPWLKSNGYLS
jgi:hypothetical protein